jgi:hypothetical protein
MDKQTRVEKYKKLREEITQMDTYKFENPYRVDEENDSLNDVGMTNEELKVEHIKKSTLSISIDQIVKAHDEYTTMIAQEKKKNKEKENKKLQFRRLISRISIVLCAILFVVVIILLVIILGGK